MLAVGLLGLGAVVRRSAATARAGAVIAAGRGVPREQWTMPPIALLARPQQSVDGPDRDADDGGISPAGAVALLVVKAIQLGGA